MLVRPRLPLLLLFVVPAAIVVAGGCTGKVDYAEIAAADGRPGGPWASPICGLDNAPLCRIRCAQHKADACNNLGVIADLRGPADAETAAELYRIACRMGSPGACFNRRRVTAASASLLEPASDGGAPGSESDAGDTDPTAWVRGSLTIDGVPFVASTCRSDEPQGFLGVDLEAASGERVRVVAGVDGSAVVVRMTGTGAGKPQKGCVTAQMHASGVVKGGVSVSVIDGSARFDCHVGVQMRGELRFRCGP